MVQNVLVPVVDGVVDAPGVVVAVGPGLASRPGVVIVN